MAGEKVLERLEHILEAISRIESFMKGKRRGRFLSDPLLVDAVERNIERISEASRHIPEEMKARFPGIAWKDIAGIGNVLRHDYPYVSPREIWDTFENDLPQLKVVVSKMIGEIERGG